MATLSRSLTSRNSHPNSNWLKFVRTSVARNKIRSYLREEAREPMIKSGLEILKKEFRRHRIPVMGVFESDEFREVVERSGFSSQDDMFAALGFGEYSVQHVINQIHDDQSIPTEDGDPGFRSGDESAIIGSSQGIEWCGGDDQIRKMLRTFAG